MSASSAILVHPVRGPSTVQISLDAANITIAYGRAGQAGYVRTETLADTEIAQRTFETRIFRLVSKGYRVGHHHPGIVDAIAESPETSDGYQVYADWLSERGDPRALLIARTTAPQTSAALADILMPHRWQFVRRDWKDYDVIWWMGFVHTVRIRYSSSSPLSREAEPDDTYIVANPQARALLLSIRRHPSGRFLRWVEAEHRIPDPQRAGRGTWVRRTVGVAFDFSVEPWVVRLIPTPSRPLNLNTASPQALAQLPGVGPVLAQRILNRRAAESGFRHVDQLGNILGVGRTTVARLRDLVMV